MCPKGSGPHSAAKQRRSFRVPPISHPQACGPKAVKATLQGRSFRVTPINSAPTRFSRGSPDLRIRKWTLECSCVPKGVGAAFCSKTAPFLSCAPNKPSGGLCAQGGQGHVLQQKQGRSFRVTPINSAPTRFSRENPDLRIRKWTLECSCVPKGVQAAFLQQKQRRSFRVPPINHPQACGPKAVKATFCSKTGPFFSCDCPNSI